MTDAPERIWAWVDYDGNWDGTWLADSQHLQPERLPDAEYVRADRIAELEAENARLRYVLEGVRGAIMTGRNEPLVIWREQIDIALDDLTPSPAP